MRQFMFLTLIGLIAACTASGQKDGTTHYGYEYKYLRKGNGKMADTGSIVYFTVEIKVDDTLDLFPRDASKEEVAKILPFDQNPSKNPVLDGLSVMREGDSILVYVNIDSLPDVDPRFKDNEMVVNRISLKKVLTEEEFEQDQLTKQAEKEQEMAGNKAREVSVSNLVSDYLAKYKSGELVPEVTLPTGLNIHVIEQGQGDPVEKGDFINAHYYGILESDGSMFDNSFKRGLPFYFAVGNGQVIQGWDQGFQELNRGSKALLFVPSELGYGERGAGGAIPGGANLIFYVEVLDK